MLIVNTGVIYFWYYKMYVLSQMNEIYFYVAVPDTSTHLYQLDGVCKKINTIKDTYFWGLYSRRTLPNVNRNMYHSTKTSQDRVDVSTLIYALVRTYFNDLAYIILCYPPTYVPQHVTRGCHISSEIEITRNQTPKLAITVAL